MQRFLKPLTLLFLGGFLYTLILTGRIDTFVNGRAALLILISALILLLMSLADLRPQNAHAPTHPRSLNLLLSLLPVILGGLLLLNPVTSGSNELLYLSWNENDRLSLYKTTADGLTDSQQLTPLQPDQQITDFALNPAGDLIAYTVQNANRSSDIWTIDPAGQLPYPLLDCLSAACSNPVWSPDGSRIIYERRPVDLPGSSRLWWLDPVSGETVPVFTDENVLGYGVQFAPNGRWFSFLSPVSQQIFLYNLETAAIKTLDSQTGETGIFHPTADYFYFTDIQFLGDVAATHIYQADLETGERGSLTNMMAAVNDGSLAWSPDGRYLAFGRQPTRTTSGKQLWLMPADGSEPLQLTHLPNINHGRPAWSPDSQQIAYQAFDTTQPSSDPAIWVININTGRARPVAPIGIMPTWLP